MILADKNPGGASCVAIDSRLPCVDLASFESEISGADKLPLPTDDWPFLYMKEKRIPKPYIYAMLFILVFSGLLLGLLKAVKGRFPPWAPNLPSPCASVSAVFLLMGIAFLLLQTKSIIQFSLLFGNTWINSSLVFLAVLILVLAANWVAAVIKSDKLVPTAFFLLLCSCLPAIFIPTYKLLVVDSTSVSFVLASLMTFLRVFFANMVFSSIFRRRKAHEIYFGWNLIGAVGGGVLEYTSVLIGYQSLALVVLILYLAVFAIYYLQISPRAITESQ